MLSKYRERGEKVRWREREGERRGERGEMERGEREENGGETEKVRERRVGKKGGGGD